MVVVLKDKGTGKMGYDYAMVVVVVGIWKNSSKGS